jgi:hypothetical protein
MYNGYKNWHTWQAALWLDNDEDYYEAAVKFMNKRHKGGKSPYSSFVKLYLYEDGRSPEGVLWLDQKISRTEMNKYMKGLING